MMNNPHRFPRPPTLPQPKIQVKTQHDPESMDTTTPPTFASMLGRNLGGNTGASSGTEDTIPISTGAFTTSFDLFSIAKMVPAKPKRVGNTTTTMEGQISDRNPLGEQSAENQNGDWRSFISNGGFGTFTFTQNQDVPKSMVFRRQGTSASIKSSVSHHHPDTSFKHNLEEDTKDKKLKTVERFTEENENPLNENNGGLRPDHFAGDETIKAAQKQGTSPSPRLDSLSVAGSPHFNQQDNSHVQEGVELQGVWNQKLIPEDMSGNVENKPELPQLLESVSIDRAQTPILHVLESDRPISHMTSIKNDVVGTLRAAAIPFEPKPAESECFTPIFDMPGIDGISRNKFQTESFTNLSDKFYGKTFNSSGESPELPSKEQNQWFLENSHRRLQLAIQSSGDESNMDLLGLGNKRALLSDAAISKLWDVDGSEGSPTDSLNINTNKQKQCLAGPFTSGKQMKPLTRDSPDLAPQNIEGSGLRAPDILRNEKHVTPKVYETLIDGFLQKPKADDRPISELGIKGVMNVREPTKNGLVAFSLTGNGFKRPTLEAQRKELMEAKGGEEWWRNLLEPTSNIKIQIRSESDGSKEAEREWPYPYPGPEGNETVASELTLALYQQLLSYLIPPVSNGMVSDSNYWSFGARKFGRSHFSTKEPWYTQDFTSYFDMSFGNIPSNRSTTVTINPPPGFPLTPGANRKEGQRDRITSENSVGIRDLIESSIPDSKSHTHANYMAREAKTLQEWNSTPIITDTDKSSINKVTEAPRKGLIGALSWNGGLGDGRRNGVISGTPSDSGSNKEISKFEFEALMRGYGADVNASIEGILNMGYTHEDLKVLTAQQSDVFGGVRKMGKIVFGSDNDS